MKTIKKIVVATDYSDNARAAYQYARHIADSFGASIHVVHVFTPTLLDAQQTIYTNMPPFDRALEDDARFLAKYVKQENDKDGAIATASRPVTTYRTQVGFVPNELIELSEDPAVDLIVLGATGEGKWLDRLLGGVADEVGRDAHCPVLLVPHGAQFKGVHRIFYAASGDSTDRNSIKTALDWAKHFGAVVDFIHIQTPEHFVKDEHVYQIALIANEIEPTVKHFVTRIESGSILEGIKHYFTINAADLIVVVTKQRDFWDNLTHHSATRELVWHNNLPILVIHQDD